MAICEIISETAESAEAAANKDATMKIAKYNSLAASQHFIQIAIGVLRTFRFWRFLELRSISEVISELGERISRITLERCGDTTSLPKAVDFTASEKRNRVQKHFRNRVIFMPWSVPVRTPNLQFCRLLAGAKIIICLRYSGRF